MSSLCLYCENCESPCLDEARPYTPSRSVAASAGAGMDTSLGFPTTAALLSAQGQLDAAIIKVKIGTTIRAFIVDVPSSLQSRSRAESPRRRVIPTQCQCIVVLR